MSAKKSEPDDRAALVAVDDFDDFSHPVQPRTFSLYIVRTGDVSLSINGTVYFLMAPCALCLSGFDKVRRLHSHMLSAGSVRFSPTFLNRNMTLERVTRADYPMLARRYDFFSLRPFLHTGDDRCFGLPLTKPALDSAMELLGRMKNERENPRDDFWSCRSRSYLMRLLMQIEEIYENYVENNTPFCVEPRKDEIPRVLEYIQTHYSEPIRMEDLCAIVKYCRTTLLKKFKQATGMTITDYIADYRMRVAQKSLRFTSLSVHEIAKECGFSYDTYFIRQFSRHCGISPTEFRRREVEQRKRDFNNCAGS